MLKFFKNCFGFVFALLLFVLIILTVVVFSLKQTVLKPDVPKEIVQETDLLTLIPQVKDEFIESQLGKDDPSSQDDKETKKEQDELKKAADEIVNSLDEDDEKIIKEFLTGSIDEGFAFLNSTDERDIVLNTGKLRPILINALVNSSFIERINAPFEICESPTQINCITKDQFGVVLEKALTKTLTKEDVLDIYPKCEPGYVVKQQKEDDLPECLTDKHIEKIQNEGVTALFGEDTDIDSGANSGGGQGSGFSGIQDETVIKYAEVDENILNIRRAVGMSDLVVLLAVVLILIFSLIIILIQGKRSLVWLGDVYLLAGLGILILFTGIKLVKIPQEYLSKLSDSSLLIAQVNRVITAYLNRLSSELLLFGVIAVIVGISLLAGHFVLRSREPKTDSVSK